MIVHKNKNKNINLYIDLINKRFGSFKYDNLDKILFGWRDGIENSQAFFIINRFMNINILLQRNRWFLKTNISKFHAVMINISKSLKII